MTVTEVASGVYRIEQASTNCYAVEDAGSLIFIDAGLPRFWREADQTVQELGRSWTDVRAIVLTHGHFDHVGFAARAHEAGVDVCVHEADARITAHPYRYQPGHPRLLYPLKYPRAIPYLTSMVVAGALKVPGVQSLRTFQGGDVLDLPSRPHVIGTPGHTDGHCAFYLPDRDLVFSGDGLVTLDPYTGRRGPRIVARAGTKDRDSAITSLRTLAQTEASIVLPGHGEPWLDGVVPAARAARLAGAA